jgi:hypothetical protein
MRKRVSAVLDTLPADYVLDEVVRRVAGSGSGYLWLAYRDGFVVDRAHFRSPETHVLRAVGVKRDVPLLTVTRPARRATTGQ